MKYLIAVVLIISSFTISYAQCQEYGVVQEYRGMQKKTPLGGVELSIVGAQSTVSKANGNFVLKFTTSKPGQAVRYNDIYKSGYVIFNKDAVGAWRISNDKRPFCIIMCKETEFRNLKKKFYGIIEKSYKEDYLRQRALVWKKNKDVLMLEQELKRIETDYQKKLSNINTYVEIFSRIDRSEMDEGERRAIQYIEEGKITEAIAEYEKLKVAQQADEQINKLKSSNEIIRAGEQMQSEAVEDLLMLSRKLQQQIAAYVIGGVNYDSVRIASIQKIISVYHQINAIGKYDYREEEGRWLVMLGNLQWDENTKLQKYRTAAELPSYCGLTSYADFCYFHTPYAAHYAIDAHESYKSAIALAKNYGMTQALQDSLVAICKTLPDFCEPIENGDTLCFKIVDNTKKTVNIVPRTNFSYNKVSEVVSIPKDIVHNGIKFNIDSIVKHALDNNRELRKIIVPQSLNVNIDGCNNLDSAIIGKAIHTINKKTTNFIHKVDVRVDSLNDKRNLQSYVDIVELVAKNIKQKYLNATLWPEYEELLSIGIIAIQTMIKNKTPLQLKKYNTAYLATTVKWAIENEMAIRYDWFGRLYNNIENKLDEKQYDNSIKIANVRMAIYRNFYGIYKMLNDENNGLAITLNENVYRELLQGGSAIDSVMRNMPIDDSIILKEALISNLQVTDLLRKYHITLQKYNQMFDVLRSVVSESRYNENVAIDKKSVVKGMPTLEPTNERTDLYMQYLHLAKLAARIVHNEVDKELFDYEELLSIGEIAIKVMCEHKESKQLAKYNNMYILTAVKWAIENEMRIKYGMKLSREISKEDEEKLHRKDLKQDEVRISIYQAVWKAKDIIPSMDKNEQLKFKDLQEINNTIRNSVSQIQNLDDKKLLIEVLNGANVVDLSKKLGLPLDKTYDNIITFLDILKNKLKSEGLVAY